MLSDALDISHFLNCFHDLSNLKLSFDVIDNNEWANFIHKRLWLNSNFALILPITLFFSARSRSPTGMATACMTLSIQMTWRSWGSSWRTTTCRTPEGYWTSRVGLVLFLELYLCLFISPTRFCFECWVVMSSILWCLCSFLLADRLKWWNESIAISLCLNCGLNEAHSMCPPSMSFDFLSPLLLMISWTMNLFASYFQLGLSRRKAISVRTLFCFLAKTMMTWIIHSLLIDGSNTVA